jgi:CubicO group peptidase (beta-lactamase class C family)
MKKEQPSLTNPRPLSERIAGIIAEAIERHIFPGAVVLIAHDDKLVHRAAYGSTMYDDDGSQPVTPETWYDIASLTKMFTATVALRLFDQGKLCLDTLASAYLPGLRATGVTVRHLLTHTSGLSVRLSALRDRSPNEIHHAIYQVEPSCPPGQCVAYVNVNSLLLGDIVAQVSGLPLDIAISEFILQPLGMQQTFFCPPPELRAAIAPTEWDDTWRNRLVQGTVHDESTHALGGVAGHAGLFSTVDDLWRFLQMWSASAFPAKPGVAASIPPLLKPEIVANATRVQTRGAQLPTFGLAFHCGFGWMKNHPIIMAYAPDDAYGHTGFTGPTMVQVPSHRLCLIILSNRTYPQRGPALHHSVTAGLLETMLFL